MTLNCSVIALDNKSHFKVIQLTVNPSLMVYNTENGASLQKLTQQEKEASGKRQWTLLLEIKKKEIKTLNTFQKLLKQISQSPQSSVQSEQAAES